MNSLGAQYEPFESIEIMPRRQQAELVADTETKKISYELE